MLNKSNMDSTISYRYRHKNQNSIYYIKPRSNEIWLLDFKVQGFVREHITTKVNLSSAFSSMQLQSGHIFVIGGQAQDLVLRSCFEIDGNMVMLEKEPMKTGRYNSALALLSDKLIFAIGGSTGKSKVTDTVECYDTTTNTWGPVGSLNKARSSTSACSVGNRYLYVFPG